MVIFIDICVPQVLFLYACLNKEPMLINVGLRGVVIYCSRGESEC